MNSLTRDAMEYLVNIAKPAAKQIEIDGKIYTDKEFTLLGEKERVWLAEAIEVTTLTSFIDYIKENRDSVNIKNTLVQITGSASVRLLSIPNEKKERETYINAAAELPRIRFNDWMDAETFIIMLQSSFVPSEDREQLMKYIGNIDEKESVSVSDDGVSQRIVAKTGIANVEKITIPNPVRLRPYRTFQELQQPESDFVFRIRKGGLCALFEADGGAWKVEARRLAKAALTEALNNVEGVVIIG